jgi:hypothetical protein
VEKPTWFEPDPTRSFDARGVVTECIETGFRSMLFDRGTLPPEFFDLSTGVAGELVHRLTVYGIRMAAVVPDPSSHSRHFQEFMLEANRGKAFHFSSTRDEAIEGLRRGPF